MQEQLAEQFLEGFRGLLNPELAAELARIADEFYRYHEQRVHREIGNVEQGEG